MIGVPHKHANGKHDLGCDGGAEGDFVAFFLSTIRNQSEFSCEKWVKDAVEPEEVGDGDPAVVVLLQLLSRVTVAKELTGDTPTFDGLLSSWARSKSESMM